MARAAKAIDRGTLLSKIRAQLNDSHESLLVSPTVSPLTKKRKLDQEISTVAKSKSTATRNILTGRGSLSPSRAREHKSNVSIVTVSSESTGHPDTPPRLPSPVDVKQENEAADQNDDESDTTNTENIGSLQHYWVQSDGHLYPKEHGLPDTPYICGSIYLDRLTNRRGQTTSRQDQRTSTPVEADVAEMGKPSTPSREHKKRPWTAEEAALITQAYKVYGTKCTVIKRKFFKNSFRTKDHIRDKIKTLKRQGLLEDIQTDMKIT